MQEINELQDVCSYSIVSKYDININNELNNNINQTELQFEQNYLLHDNNNTAEIEIPSLNHSNVTHTHAKQSASFSSTIVSRSKSPLLSSDYTPDDSIQTFLASWAMQYNIPHNAVNGLLKGLKQHDCFDHLPVDCRTLLQTPTSGSKHIRVVEPGVYHHFGSILV